MERTDIMSKIQIAWLGFLLVGGVGVLFIFPGVMITLVTRKQTKQCTKKIEGTVVQYQFPGGGSMNPIVEYVVDGNQVGLMTRYINFCNRERTEFEEWVLQAMLGIEEVAMRRNGINSITKVIPGVTDDMLSAMNSTGIISGYMEVGRVYTGKNILKNHWPIISIIVAILISIVITVTR